MMKYEYTTKIVSYLTYTTGSSLCQTRKNAEILPRITNA